MGVLCAQHANRLPDHLGRVLSLLGHSMPIFWLGIVGLLVFYAHLGWVAGPGRLDMTYRYSVPAVTHLMLVDTALAGQWDAFCNALSHLILPATLLGLVALGYVARMTRGFLLWQLRQDYTTVLRLKGLSDSAILWRHALRNALIPLATRMSEIFTLMFAGALLIEKVFDIDGMGLLYYNSMVNRDYNVVLGIIMLSSFMAMLGRLFSDLLYTWVDPRIQFK